MSSNSGPSTGTPAQQAATAARALLRDFVPPPGTTRHPGEPASDHGGLTAVAGVASAAMVRDTSWWLASGPDDVILYEKAHLPAGLRPSFASTGGSTLTQAFELLPDKAPLTGQYLLVSIAPADGGKTAVRVDAVVTYQPIRPASERVPATATEVTITLRHAFEPSSGPTPAPITVTRPAVVRQLIALVDGLPLSTAPTGVPCTSGPPDRVELAFKTGTGHVVADVQGPRECEEVSFTINGVIQPALTAPGSFVTQVIRLAGLRWRVS